MIKIFETYSNVYNTAMMVDQRQVAVAPKARTSAVSKFTRLFRRG